MDAFKFCTENIFINIISQLSQLFDIINTSHVGSTCTIHVSTKLELVLVDLTFCICSKEMYSISHT